MIKIIHTVVALAILLLPGGFIIGAVWLSVVHREKLALLIVSAFHKAHADSTLVGIYSTIIVGLTVAAAAHYFC